jgi:hypothetical protein
MDVRPGLNIRVVTAIDFVKETVRVANAVIYDVDEPNFTISQTDPPLLKSMVDREIEITYLAREKDKLARCGFPARVTGFIDNYPLNRTHKVKAVVVSRLGEESPYNLRMFYRVEPRTRNGLAISLQGEPMHVLDISVGGAKLSYPKTLKMKANSFPDATLHIDAKKYSIRTRIVRTWDGNIDGFNPDLRFAAVEFLHSDANLERVLLKKIREIEVEDLQK